MQHMIINAIRLKFVTVASFVLTGYELSNCCTCSLMLKTYETDFCS